MITGNTELIAHIGYPTHTFKSPMIYNPYFEQVGVNAVVVPMGCKPVDYPAFLKAVFSLTNIRGALITMPHKVVTVGLLDEVTPTVNVAGACNAVKRLPDGVAGTSHLRGGRHFVQQADRDHLVWHGDERAADVGQREDALEEDRVVGRLATHGHHDGVHAHVFKVGVVDHRRLEAVRRVADVGDEFGVAVDHGGALWGGRQCATVGRGW
jgi:hypothetical protein